MDGQVGESMILEEEIDENYEPTEQEILEYAKFLGMDLVHDRDLFWIAREGLQAPLPEPWKPCQTKEGEIYYFNFKSGESQWEHPCDEYYKKMYEKEKKKKVSQPSKHPLKKEIKENKAQASPPIQNEMRIPTSKLASKQKDALAFAGEMERKAADPLLKAQQEKKMNNYKEKKEQELKEKKEKLDKEIDDKKRQMELEHKKAMEALEKKYDALRKEEEERLRDEYKPLDEYEIPREKAKYAEQVKKELEAELQKKLDAHKESLEAELSNMKKEFEQQKKEKVKELHARIGGRYKGRIEELEDEIAKLKTAISNDQGLQDDGGVKVKEQAIKAFMSEQEAKFLVDKENLRKQINQETKMLKQKEDEKLQEEINKLYQEFEKETKGKDTFDEERCRTELEVDLKVKLDQYRTQVNRKFEIMKLNSLDKLKDYEKEKMEEFRAGLGNELEYLEDELKKEKAELEAKFQKDKIKAERKVEEDIAAYREISMKKLEEKKKMLDNERLEKLTMLKIKLSTIKDVNPEDLKSAESKLSEMEQKISKYQKILDEKQEEYKKELAIKDKLLAEIADVETKMSGAVTADGQTVDAETKTKIDQLNRAIKEKNQMIETLKKEKNRGEGLIQNPSLLPDAYEVNYDDIQQNGEDSFEMDKIHLDLEDIKKFIRGKTNRDGPEFKEHKHERQGSDMELRHQYRQYQNGHSGKDNSSVSIELSKDRLALEKKKGQLMRDLEVLNRDRETHRGNPEKQEFLRNVKKLIQQKLSRVNNQLDYLIRLSGKIERSASFDRMGLKPQAARYQNNYMADSHSEAFSEDVDTS